MLTIFGFALGLAGGAAGTAAWLLSEPDSSASMAVPEALQERFAILQTRFQEALIEGKRAGAETENRLRQELETYRRHPDRPGTSSR